MEMTFVAVIVLVFGAVYLPGYVLNGIGLYAIAKRRGIDHPWIAWIPLGNLWLLGCISDQYQAIVKGKQKNKRTILLLLLLAVLALYGLMMGMLSAGTDNALPFLLMFVPMWCAAAAAVVIGFVAMYDLYVSCDPKNAVLFLVLSIVLSVTQPFFLFACRKKDLGFPL